MKLTIKEHRILTELIHSYAVNAKDDGGNLPKHCEALLIEAKLMILNASVGK